MKKFFDEYPLPVLLAAIVIFAPPACWVISLAFSMVADGGDPVLVFILLCVISCLAMFILSPLASIALVVLSLAFGAAGWLAKKVFFWIRHLINRRRHNPA